MFTLVVMIDQIYYVRQIMSHLKIENTVTYKNNSSAGGLANSSNFSKHRKHITRTSKPI